MTSLLSFIRISTPLFSRSSRYITYNFLLKFSPQIIALWGRLSWEKMTTPRHWVNFYDKVNLNLILNIIPYSLWNDGSLFHFLPICLGCIKEAEWITLSLDYMNVSQKRPPFWSSHLSQEHCGMEWPALLSQYEVQSSKHLPKVSAWGNVYNGNRSSISKGRWCRRNGTFSGSYKLIDGTQSILDPRDWVDIIGETQFIK